MLNKQGIAPKHPETVVVEPNDWYPKGLTESDIYGYYDKIKGHLLEPLKGQDVFVMIATDDAVYKRYPDGEGVIQINTVEELDEWNDGRTMEFHNVFGGETPYYFVDIHPGEDFPWERTKELAVQVADMLDNMEDVKLVEILFSGGKGFHVYGFLYHSQDVNEARNYIRENLNREIVQDDEMLTTTGISTPAPKMCQLDNSTLRRSGSLRSKYSLHSSTGLVCTDVPDIKKFNKKDATIKNVLHRLGLNPGSNINPSSDPVAPGHSKGVSPALKPVPIGPREVFKHEYDVVPGVTELNKYFQASLQGEKKEAALELLERFGSAEKGVLLARLVKEAGLYDTLRWVLDLVSPFVYLFVQNPKLKQAYSLLREVVIEHTARLIEGENAVEEIQDWLELEAGKVKNGTILYLITQDFRRRE